MSAEELISGCLENMEILKTNLRYDWNDKRLLSRAKDELGRFRVWMDSLKTKCGGESLCDVLVENPLYSRQAVKLLKNLDEDLRRGKELETFLLINPGSSVQYLASRKSVGRHGKGHPSRTSVKENQSHSS